MEPTILFDYDDTLGGVRFRDGSVRPGAAAYFDCIDRVGGIMQQQGLDPAEAKAKQHLIDIELVGIHGFAVKTRFADSMVEAYRSMCPSPIPSVADRVHAIGMSVFTRYPYAALEGALDVVDRLSRFYKIVIVTKGEADEQRKKLRESGIDAFAETVFVVDRKDGADWHTVLDHLGYQDANDASESWAIGNSAKADVNPMLLAGFNGIHVAGKNNWAYENAELGEALDGRIVRTVTDISDVLSIVPHPTTSE